MLGPLCYASAMRVPALAARRILVGIGPQVPAVRDSALVAGSSPMGVIDERI